MSSPLLYQLSYLVRQDICPEGHLSCLHSSLVFSEAAEVMEPHCHCDLHSSLEALHTEVTFEHIRTHLAGEKPN